MRIPKRKTYEGSDVEILPVEHLCHARNCKVPMPPRMLMCAPHWRMVPLPIQRLVWKHYRPGQEIDKRPAREYLEVMKQAIDAVAEREGLKENRE